MNDDESALLILHERRSIRVAVMRSATDGATTTDSVGAALVVELASPSIKHTTFNRQSEDRDVDSHAAS